MFKRSLTTPGSLKSLDGLRAIAILLVLMTHVSQHIPGISFVHFNMEWATPLYNGWIGVDLFFVLSGYLVGSMVIKQLNQNTFTLPSFFLSRFFRIIPAYFAVILFILFLKHGFPVASQSFLPAFGKKDVLENALLLTDYLPGYMAIQSWSLSIEEHFYLLLPFFLIFFRKFDTRVYAAIALVFIALIARMVTYRYFAIGEATPIASVLHYIYFPFHERMDSLAMGVLVALLHAHAAPVDRIYRVVVASLGLLLVGFIGLCGELKGGFYNTTIQYSLVCVGFGGILWGVLGSELAERSRAEKFLAAKFWVPVARLSYSVYLSHMVVLLVLSHNVALKIWMFPFVIAACLLAALPLYWLVEYPCHQFARKRFKVTPALNANLVTA